MQLRNALDDYQVHNYLIGDFKQKQNGDLGAETKGGWPPLIYHPVIITLTRSPLNLNEFLIC